MLRSPCRSSPLANKHAKTLTARASKTEKAFRQQSQSQLQIEIEWGFSSFGRSSKLRQKAYIAEVPTQVGKGTREGSTPRKQHVHKAHYWNLSVNLRVAIKASRPHY